MQSKVQVSDPWSQVRRCAEKSCGPTYRLGRRVTGARCTTAGSKGRERICGALTARSGVRSAVSSRRAQVARVSIDELTGGAMRGSARRGSLQSLLAMAEKRMWANVQRRMLSLQGTVRSSSRQGLGTYSGGMGCTQCHPLRSLFQPGTSCRSFHRRIDRQYKAGYRCQIPVVTLSGDAGEKLQTDVQGRTSSHRGTLYSCLIQGPRTYSRGIDCTKSHRVRCKFPPSMYCTNFHR
jgi:hypothetical protein